MIALTLGAAIGAVAMLAVVAALWLWQAGRRPGPPGPLARRLGPFLDLLDARYAPLLFVATPQAYTVYAWLLTDGAPPWVAVLGGVGFEFVYVGAIAWAERGAGWTAARVPAITALVFSVAVAVAHYGATSGPLAVLHIGFPLVGYAYMRMMHAPNGTGVSAVPMRERLAVWWRGDVGHAPPALVQPRPTADHALALPSQAGEALDHETVQIGGRSYSTRDAAAALGISKTTLTRKLAQVGPEEN